jgi:hypothetical protein
MRKLREKEAALRNGANSDGPVTPEGNKHSLLAEAIIISGEAADRLAALSAQFHAEFRPRTQTETQHVETMIMCRWRLHRIWEFESAGLNHEIDRLTAAGEDQSHRARAVQAFRNLSDQSRSLDLLSRSETKLARDFIRAYQALMELKSKPVPDWHDHQEHSVLIAAPDLPVPVL